MAVAGAMATPAEAGRTFGSDLVGQLMSPPDCNSANGYPCTIASIDAAPLPEGSPIPGVVTRFRMRSASADSLSFRVLKFTGGIPGSGRGRGKTAQMPVAANPSLIQSFPAALPIEARDRIGFDDSAAPLPQSFAQCESGSSYLLFSPALPVNDSVDRSANTFGFCEVQLQGIVETDVDEDGLGDETQDGNVRDRRCAVPQHGNSRRNRIVGFPTGDRLFGRNGNDKLIGLAGADCLDGGFDHDKINGGAGKDRILAGDNDRDVVRCGSGRDRARVDRSDVVSGCERIRVSGRS